VVAAEPGGNQVEGKLRYAATQRLIQSGNACGQLAYGYFFAHF
jgi:hypothetical protein